jgi:hypothetical protein
VLLAMDRYFNTFEATTPDFVARMWLGETYVAEHTFQGRTTETQQTVVPMSFLVEQPGTQDLVIGKEGDGRLYYRLGLRYAPTDLGLDPLDMGFVVQRTYERWTIRRTCAATRRASGTSRPGRACACG